MLFYTRHPLHQTYNLGSSRLQIIIQTECSLNKPHCFSSPFQSGEDSLSLDCTHLNVPYSGSDGTSIPFWFKRLSDCIADSSLVCPSFHPNGTRQTLLMIRPLNTTQHQSYSKPQSHKKAHPSWDLILPSTLCIC